MSTIIISDVLWVKTVRYLFLHVFIIITALEYYKKAMQIGTFRNNDENKNLTQYRCR